MEVSLKQDERIDDLERSDLRIIQDPKRFCFGMDAVLLSGFAKAKEGDEVVDYCTGTGIIPILMTAKTKASHFTAVEIQEDSADMARRSVQLNDLEQKISVITGNLTEGESFLKRCSADVVTVNPPYLKAGSGIVNETSAKAIARHEISCSLEELLKESYRVLKPGGHFYMVHRPFRLSEILNEMHLHKLEPKRIRFVHPFVSAEPTMILVEGLKDGSSGMVVEKPFILYESEGVYTRELVEDYGF